MYSHEKDFQICSQIYSLPSFNDIVYKDKGEVIEQK